MDIMNVEEYKTWICRIARRFKQSQIKAATAVNVEMLKFYWSLGADIVRLEKDQPWGSKFMQRVSADLKAWMPEAKCFLCGIFNICDCLSSCMELGELRNNLLRNWQAENLRNKLLRK